MTPRDSHHGSGYLPTLDGWRAIAIALVLLDHAGDAFHSLFPGMGNDAFQDLKERCGLFGVHIFFTLSGYLITARLAREADAGRPSLRAFYLRRLFRIQPAALTFLAIAGALALAGAIPVSFAAWRSAILCYANFHTTDGSWYVGHFWSLSIEEHFYLVWPLLFVLLGQRRLIGAAVLVVGLSLWRALAVKFQIAMTTGWIVRTDMQAESLAWGCLLALAQRQRRWAVAFGQIGRPATLACCLALAGLAAFWSSGSWKVNHVLSSTGASAIALAIVMTSINPGSRFGRVLELAAIRWVGRISYSLYLWQQLFFTWDSKRAPALHVVQRFPVSLVVSVALAAASYYVIEQPMIRVGKRFMRQRRSATSEAEEVSVRMATQGRSSASAEAGAAELGQDPQAARD